MAATRSATIYAWCVMPDHVHLLVQDQNLPELIRLLKGRITPAARHHLKGMRLWQRSYYDHALRSEEALNEAARYIWHNPVRKGIVDHPSAYPWCDSLFWPDWRNWVGEHGPAGA